MNDDAIRSRMSEIATEWTVIRRAHEGSPDEMVAAQAALFQRYQRAIYAYLVASLRSPDAADELFQEFAVRFLEGRFRGADPQRGRFRDYLKTALARLLMDHRRQAAQRPQSLDLADAELSEPVEAAVEAASFESTWRSTILQRAWEALEDEEGRTQQPIYRVLRWRTEHPAASSEEMAAFLTRQTDKTYQAAAARKLLQRARERFADLLLDEVAASVQTCDLHALEEELIALDLLRYCRSAVERRRSAAETPDS